jgi:glyoxylase-like metal-dependent hydrolase (beta-lactamase superfamily II)
MERIPEVTAFFDTATNTISYLVADPVAGKATVVDPVLDYDPHVGRTSTAFPDGILATAAARHWAIELILETHVHADHLTAAAYIKQKTGAPVAIGAAITRVQDTFGALFNIRATIAPGGRDFDLLLSEGSRLTIGGLEGRVMATPGHTPACSTYVFGDAAFVGDTIFMPDYGTARCDFPGGDAATLYRSIQRILALPPDTRVFVGHDYPTEQRPARWQSSVAGEKSGNIHVHAGVSESEFVVMRAARDKTLKLPTLLLPSVQWNMRAGKEPPAEDNGTAYLKIPLNRL